MAKPSTKTNKLDNIGDLQTILANNLLDLVSKRKNGKLVEQDLQYSRTLINNSGKKTVKKSDKTNVEYQEYYKIKLSKFDL